MSSSRPSSSSTLQPLSSCLCLVTGASSGIGRATCQTLTSQGAKVVGTARTESALVSLKEAGAIAGFVVADLSEQGECERIVTEAVEMLGGELTTLINVAGVLRMGAMGSVDLANFEVNMRTNTQAPFELMVHAIPHLKRQQEKQQGGSTTAAAPSIINVSSVNGKQAFPGCVSYCMSKAALDQLTRCASVDLAPFGIRVNAVNPGVIQTNLHKAGGVSEENYEKFLERSIKVTHPISSSLGRVGTPEEVGELIAFLASDKAKFLTGECIAIDGGRQNLGAR